MGDQRKFFRGGNISTKIKSYRILLRDKPGEDHYTKKKYVQKNNVHLLYGNIEL